METTGRGTDGSLAERSIYDVLEELRELSTSEADKGTRFEKLVKAYLRADPMWQDQYDEVWLWGEWPGNGGHHDAGIDLVARERTSGDLTAVQAKFYASNTTISKADIDTFLSASGKIGFTSRLIVSTNDRWSAHAEATVKDQQVPVRRIGLADLEASPIDWGRFLLDKPENLVLHAKKNARPHQREAIDSVVAGFTSSDRGKLVMACGTGKTLTSLRLAEELVGPGGKVLFLVPSIALLSQSLREWVTDATVELTPLAVCSDRKVAKKAVVDEDISTVDLALPATTDVATLAHRFRSASAERMTVVFATYQSIDVVAQAQRQGMIDAFDLILCDEAHRTTGVTLAGQEESAFVRVHNNEYVRGTKRLYMTATPRIYGDSSKAKAGEVDAVVASMDDDELFGPEFYRLGFGEAVSRDLLADYKVLVLAVDEASVARTFQEQFKDANNELQLNDYAKIVGCWNGLSKRGDSEHSFADDPQPMRRAVAFAGSIADSKRIEDLLPGAVQHYIESHNLNDQDDSDIVLHTQVQHVDGTMSALERNTKIDWIKQDPAQATCRVLTNARCLSEGVDVPALDGVMFLSPRKSIVDVVQSVGRVMRKAPGTGKKYGYIILPIGIPAGMEPEDALKDNDRYRVVWEVLQALRAHDERFDATVNRIDLNKGRDPKINVIGIKDSFGDGGSGTADDDTKPSGEQMLFAWPELEDWRDAIYARIVKKVGNRRYWETWAKDVAEIAQTHRTRIAALLAAPDSGVRTEFATFLEGLRGNLNDSISEDDAIDMLSQHLITRPVFDALFEGYEFTANNPVAQAMERMLEVLDEHRLEDEHGSLEKFYESVRVRAKGIDNAEGRQKIIVELYDNFFKTAFPQTVAKLGIVYTPIELVDFILRSADWALRQEFGQGLTDSGVHVLDGFTGTGTFVVRLIQSGLIDSADLARKFTAELHANEFLLLAYYIAAINIETAFHDIAKQAQPDAPYEPFPGLILTDTFQSYEEGDTADLFVLPGNNDRIERQRSLDIRVVVGNPPYSAGQSSANDDNANEQYPSLDAAIRETYAARSSAKLKNKLYDSYVRAIKWASLRVKDRGVVAFVTNGGWLEGTAHAGMRLSIADEFAKVYIFNLRGNQRTSGEVSRREGGKIFDAGSRATVAVFLLVKNAEHTGPAEIYYRDIGDYLTREEKLQRVREAASMATLPFERITPNADGDWIGQRSDEFKQFLSLDDIFRTRTYGVNTGRDAWVYNSSRPVLEANVRAAMAHFNSEVDRWQRSPGSSKDEKAILRWANKDPRKISWSSNLLKAVPRGARCSFEATAMRESSYRPFFKQWLYCDRLWNSRPGDTPDHFGPGLPNTALYIVGANSAVPFSALLVDEIPNLHLTGAGSGGQVYLRYLYEPIDPGELELGSAAEFQDSGFRRMDNISDAALTAFRKKYGSAFSSDDVFHYCYGILHSSDYRSRYAADLRKVVPRIPMVDDPQPFVEAGNRLAQLHLGYETVPPARLGGADVLPSSTDTGPSLRVTKMRYAKRRDGGKQIDDKSVIVLNDSVTITGIPLDAHRYTVGSKSALDWLVERYAVTKDKASGLVNDPNDWSTDSRYIFELIGRVVALSTETNAIVDAMPPLR